MNVVIGAQRKMKWLRYYNNHHNHNKQALGWWLIFLHVYKALKFMKYCYLTELVWTPAAHCQANRREYSCHVSGDKWTQVKWLVPFPCFVYRFEGRNEAKFRVRQIWVQGLFLPLVETWPWINYLTRLDLNISAWKTDCYTIIDHLLLLTIIKWWIWKCITLTFWPRLPAHETTIWLSAALGDVRYLSSLDLIPLPRKDPSLFLNGWPSSHRRRKVSVSYEELLQLEASSWLKEKQTNLLLNKLECFFTTTTKKSTLYGHIQWLFWSCFPTPKSDVGWDFIILSSPEFTPFVVEEESSQPCSHQKSWFRTSLRYS